jgi:DNA-binding NarL/FixJ family response regulator
VIAEDEDGFAELIRTLLHEDGRFQVVARAANGNEAVALVAEHRPDLVLMDIVMPVRDGIEATRLIHERDPSQHVVVYTGSDMYADVLRAEAVGVEGYLHKEALRSPALAETLLVLHRNHEHRLPDPGAED